MFYIGDLFQWERFITPSIIKLFYWLIVIMVVLAGLSGLVSALGVMMLNPIVGAFGAIASFAGMLVGILFARRDFLSAFISCFMPIIVVYYPIILFGVNLGKEGIISPYCVWAGNLVLWTAAWFWALPPVRKH